MKLAREAVATPDIARTPQNPTATTGLEADGSTGDVRAADDDRSEGNAAAQRQTEGPSNGQTEGAADRQPEGALQSALSRLGGMLESGGRSMHQMCSQFEAPAGQFCQSVSQGVCSRRGQLSCWAAQSFVIEQHRQTMTQTHTITIRILSPCIDKPQVKQLGV